MQTFQTSKPISKRNRATFQPFMVLSSHSSCPRKFYPQQCESVNRSMVENNIESIAKTLEQTLLPQFSKVSEQELKSIELSAGFSINLLKIISANEVNGAIRLAGSIFLKNLIKRKWINENGEYILPIDDINYIKGNILTLMISLPNNLQIQIGECIALIAELDFPHNWQTLIDDLISKFSESDFKTNKSILLVSHSIFKKWRPLFRSDELFLEIKMVLDKFAQPFLTLLQTVDRLIESSLAAGDVESLKIYLDNLLLLVQIYYDLNCQDIPEFFEDNLVAGMEIMHKYLNFESKLITDPDNDEEVDVIIKIKTSIIELINLYITRYTEVFEPLIENFIKTIWENIISFITKQPKFDLLIIKCLQFLTLIIKIPKFQSIFNNDASMNEILDKIILPNVHLREVDLEIFEDEPINFVRFDLEGSEFDSRRKSATDFLRELKEINNELLTEIVMKYVNNFLSNGSSWQNKDMAIYLFSSLAAKGTLTNIGVTSTNVLVDVVQFFSDNIANDLVNSDHSTNPILIVDSIKYILIFRNQLTKDQLLSVIPLLINHLNNANPVIYTYASIVIEKLLSMTSFNDNDHKPIFNKFDVKPFENELLSNLFKLINKNSNLPPEKLSENEFLIKAIMRVLNTLEDSISHELRLTILSNLIDILIRIAKNPANPKFSHYCFESLGLIVKFSKPEEVNSLIGLILPNLINILNEDVQEFVPYTFQVLAYLLERLPKSGNQLPEDYKALIKPLMSPALWQFRGNIPGITRLLISIIRYDPSVFTTSADSLTPLLGVFQKLIASKLNETYGFELLENILLYFPVNVLEPYLKNIAILLLTRLKNTRTDKFLKRFIIFVTSISSLPNNPELYTVNRSLNGDFVLNLINLPQGGVFEQVLSNLILPNMQTFQNLRDKKINLIGLLELVTSSLLAPELKLRILEQISKSLASFSSLNRDNSLINDQFVVGALNELDIDSQSSFGSGYSKLASIQLNNFDPLSNIKNNELTHIKQIVSGNLQKVDPSIIAQLPADLQSQLRD